MTKDQNRPDSSWGVTNNLEDKLLGLPLDQQQALLEEYFRQKLFPNQPGDKKPRFGWEAFRSFLTKHLPHAASLAEQKPKPIKLPPQPVKTELFVESTPDFNQEKAITTAYFQFLAKNGFQNAREYPFVQFRKEYLDKLKKK